MPAEIHIASEGDPKTMCGLRTTDSVVHTPAPSRSTCGECFQLALEEMDRLDVPYFLGNSEGRKS